MTVNEPTLKEARDRLHLLSTSLPVAVDPLAVSKIAKTPTTALCYREAQAWRMEEFCRAACDMFERGDIVVAASNARHAAECCAGVFYLLSLIEKTVADPKLMSDTHDKVLRLQVGFKKKIDGDMPEAINAQTMVEKLDKIIPGYFRVYADLSEIAHPNWAGSAAIFSKLDKETLITHFGRGLRDIDYSKRLVLNCIIGSLTIFGHGYNKIGDLIPPYVAVCEAAIAERNSQQGETTSD